MTDFWKIGTTYIIELRNNQLRTITVEKVESGLLYGTDKSGVPRAINLREILEAREKTQVAPDDRSQ